MGYGERATVQRVREALEARGVEARIVELERTARSAREAADVLGVRVEQMMKPLVETSPQITLRRAGATMTVSPRRYGHRSSRDRGGLHKTRGG